MSLLFINILLVHKLDIPASWIHLLLLSRRRRFTSNCRRRRYHRTKSLRPGSIHPTFAMLFSARFGAGSHTQSFLNSKFGMRFVHLKIEKCQLERARPMEGVDLVLTEWTPSKVDSQNEKSKFDLTVPRACYCSSIRPAASPMPCGAGSST